MDYVLIAENPDDAPVEFPLEDDSTLLLSTVEAQFVGATGLKFVNPATGAHRVVRLVEGRLYPPEKEGSGWGDRTYFTVYPKDVKRKHEEDEKEKEPVAPKVPKTVHKCRDLIVLGLPWETTDETLKAYFEKNYGEVAMASVKLNKNGRSRGFGFVRFNDYEIQRTVMLSRHEIDGRWCDVSFPPSAKACNNKIFVGRLTTDISADDLRQYFAPMGDITDSFIPKPFRGIGFVAFLDPDVARQACLMGDHVIKGVTVHVELATPKPSNNDRRSGGGGGGFQDRNGRGGNSFDDRWDNNSRGRGGGSGGGRWNDDDFNSGPSNRRSAGAASLRSLSPNQLLSVIEEAGLADALANGLQNYAGRNNFGPNSRNRAFDY
ncbi:mRNA Hypothetical protein [Nesidiocoris tenuis]|uniref:RRM domain-containing protein n=1 Tax=Nesidiocoris tenuis TaxID=355587 RepID=A0ABN7AJ26_9HEMI|nr:mRNA Hypothetical protein [Nesidiocoris tenuis]